ncbi:LysM peptidoglycan-binding domain-containing protein [Stenotrophobium rhamnosiphilum]|nr:LysM peptidoglycan-binding domain-containing protein [Stenotrophobium rhamnosiphilum]
MVNYNGLVRVKVLLLGSLLLGTTSAFAAITPAPDAQESAAAQPAGKTTPALREQVPLQYVVKKGDTLWSISNHFLLNAWEWPEIWFVNGQVRNPHKIYPGDVLSLMVRNGRPQLVVQTPTMEDRLSPQVRASTLDQPIAAIPIDAIRDFLSSPRIVTKEQMKKAPYVLDFVDEHLMAGAASKFYVRRLPVNDATVDYNVVRLGPPYKDPQSDELLGYQATDVGYAEIESAAKDPGIALLTKTTREVLVGDYLIPVDAESFDAFFYPHAPKNNVNGTIISVYDGVTQIGQYQVVVLNRGSRDGIELGHVLTVMQSNRIAKDPYATLGNSRVKLPDAKAGTMMVFKVAPRVSFALIMDATRSIKVLDKAVKPSSD